MSAHFSFFILLFIVTSSLCAVQLKPWECLNINNSLQVHCNTTVRDFFMNIKQEKRTFTNCVFEPVYFNINATNCNATFDNGVQYRVSCNGRINTDLPTNFCKIFKILSHEEGEGTYNPNALSVMMTQTRHLVYECKSKWRYKDFPYYFNWEYLYSCADADDNLNFEANCYNYARFFPNLIYCQYYKMLELKL